MRYITSSQSRAARGLLDWSQPELAQKCDMHVQTICAFENETGTPTKRTLEKIMLAFETAGIEFTKDEGIKRSSLITKTFHDRIGFIEFKNFVFETVRDHGGEMCASNVDETIFTQRLSEEEDNIYMDKMKKIKGNFSFKILIKEGDTNFIASDYAEYRWTKKEDFHDVPFYVFGDYLAFLIFEERTTIHLIQNAKIADVQRAQFNLAWERAKPVQ